MSSNLPSLFKDTICVISPCIYANVHVFIKADYPLFVVMALSCHLSDLAYDTSIISHLLLSLSVWCFYSYSVFGLFFLSFFSVWKSLGNAEDLPNSHTYTHTLLGCQSALPIFSTATFLYCGEKVLLIRTGLSLSAIHHHLTYWSSLLITLSLSLSRTLTRAHIYK